MDGHRDRHKHNHKHQKRPACTTALHAESIVVTVTVLRRRKGTTCLDARMICYHSLLAKTQLFLQLVQWTFWCRCIRDRQATHCTSSHCRAYILPSSCQLCRALGRACMHGALPPSKLARALFFSKRNLLTAGTTEHISIFSAGPAL